MRSFVDEHDADGFPHVNDPDQLLWSRFGVSEHRTYVYIDDDGTFRLSGYGSLRSDVQELIAG